MKLDVKIPFRDIERIECCVPGARTSAQAVQAGNGADLVINTAIFDMRTGEILSRVAAEGRTYGTRAAPAWGLEFPEGGAPARVWDNGRGCPHYLGPYSYAVVDGKVRDGLQDSAHRGRMLVGIADDSLVVLGFDDQDPSRCSSETACRGMLSRGCTFAVNLDGGASVQWAGSFGGCRGGRKVPAFLCIWLKKGGQEPERKPPVVCIDAGHGAETAGKCSPDGSYYEHEFNLDVARRVKEHLERCGVRVVMTREDEHDVSLKERCRIANGENAGLFLSVHSNAAGEKGWYKAEDGFLWNTAQGWSAHIVARGGKAEQLAGHIRAFAVPMLRCRDRGVEVSNYQVLRDTGMPAVLIEHGFHTSRAEVEKLKTDAYRALCAESDARGILAFLGLTWSETEEECMVKATATKKQGVYTQSGAADKGRYIDRGDVCTLGPMTENLLVRVVYPVSGGTRTAYVKSLEGFER